MAKTRKQLPNASAKTNNANAAVLQELQDKINVHENSIEQLNVQVDECAYDEIKQCAVKKKLAKEKAELKKLQLQVKNLT